MLPARTLPMSPEALHREMLLAAGLDDEALASLLRSAATVARESMSAVRPAKRRVKTGEDGSVEVTEEDGGAPDWDARHRGADLALDLTGARAPRSNAAAGAGKVELVVQIAGWVPRNPAE